MVRARGWVEGSVYRRWQRLFQYAGIEVEGLRYSVEVSTSLHREPNIVSSFSILLLMETPKNRV